MLKLLAGIVSVILLTMTMLAKPAAVSEWPLFRGNPEQTGVALSKIPTKLDVLWSYKAEDAIENAVGVSNGVVFAASMDEHLYAIDLESGKLRWKQKAAPFKSAPVTREANVYVGDLDGFFHCFDQAKGTKKWSFETGSEVGGANFFKDSILLSSHDEHLYRISSTGKEIWKFRTDGPIYGSPTVADGRTFLVGCDSMMHVIDVDTGKEISSVELDGQSGATAGVLDDFLYVGTMRNEVKSIDWKKNSVVWTFKAGRSGPSFYSSPAVTQKYVVIGSRDNKVYCIDRNKGTEVWTFTTGNKVDSSPVVTGTSVVVGSQDGKLYVLDLESGKVMQTFTLDGPTNASPVIVDGKILIGTQEGTLYCLGTKS